MGQISKRKNNFAIMKRWQCDLTRSLAVLAALTFILVSCNDSEETVAEKDTTYFPLKVGAYQIYTVEETQIDQVNTIELKYELRTEVTDSFPNQNGGYTYIITRAKRNNSTLPWKAFDSWSARVDDKQAVVNEENIPYVKESFPLLEGKTWNGNLLNALGGNEKCGTLQESCDIYSLEDVARPYEINPDLSFAKTITIIQNDDHDAIVGEDVRKEVYAQHVGLIYKETSILEYCTVGSCVGKQEIVKGLIYTQVIHEYGGY
jgi:hypothetical protein